jgi:hypothetical protein
MSNCYDHEIKMNMLRDKPLGTIQSVKKELDFNKLRLTNWFYEQLKNYDYAEENTKAWYENYKGE